MSIRSIYTQEYICDGCKATMVSGSGSPPGWDWKEVDSYVTLHACLRCELAPLVQEYIRRKFQPKDGR
jgi:hypothetical protein